MKRKWVWVSTLVCSLGLPTGVMCARANATPAPSAAALAPYQEYQERPWDQPPDEYRDVQRQGFHDGIEAARQDMDDHRHRDADDHERFRHPPVDRDLRHDYRDGFRRGYEAARHHFEEHHGW